MSEETAMIDPSSWAEKLKDKIRGEIAGLLPDELLKGAIEAEIKLFTEGHPGHIDPWGHRNGQKEPGLRVLVRQVLTEHVKSQFDAEFKKPEWGVDWKTRVSEAAVEIARDNLHVIMEGMVTQVVQQALSNIHTPPGQY